MLRITFALPALLAAMLFTEGGAILGEESVGRRPYEMVWANRTRDTRPPLVDFENLDGWTVTCVDAQASFQRSRQQQLWGKYVGSLVYRGTGKAPKVLIRPPKPIPVAAPFDCVNLWVYGNNWAWSPSPDPKTPQVRIAVLLRGANGQEVRLLLGRVQWKEWWLMHHRLTPSQLALVGDGASVAGIEVADGRNTEDRALYFDNLAVYREPLPPLKFNNRPARPFDPCPDGTRGVNVGPQKLPFPTRPQTILPDNLTAEFKTSVEPAGKGFVFHYRGKDGHLVYRYTPATGTLGDLTAQWESGTNAGKPFQPLAGGGVRFSAQNDTATGPPEKIEFVGCRQNGNAVEADWRCTSGRRTADLRYTFELLQKSLLVTVRCPGGEVGEFCVGKAVGLDHPRLVTLPYLTGDRQRPAVVVAGAPQEPLFVTALLDYYMSNASSLWAANKEDSDGAVYNGGSRYLPKTDGRRNNCYERVFLTVSPRFEEILPNVANPKSPWMHVTGERLWIAHGASDRQKDYEQFQTVARYGMTKLVITDHETGWRDGGESFTFRTRAAPGRGGDEGQADYARRLHALGFRYGIYNNYTDYAPVNEFWDEDRVTRLSDGQWKTAWTRCYNPKPARAVEFEARLAPIIQQKFHLDTAYCDVHTAVTPWAYCDFDARTPRAGTFAGTFYAYGEIMLHQKKTWNGPVYSEGNNHWYYCGLTDGNYGQDQAARLSENPWLVDFDLRKLHPLCCNFGMGNPGMFFGNNQNLGATPEEREARLDRFLAATLAFGHTGFLVLDGGMDTAVRSYFSVQQVHAAYAQQTVAEIRYADAAGRLLDTSAAVAGDAFRRSQIVTRYANGLLVTVNGHPTETWKTSQMALPPNGWCVRDGQDGKLLAWSALIDGHRADYVDSPAYLYANGRGQFTRFDKAACDGQLIVHKRADGAMEVIPVGPCRKFGVALPGPAAAVVALDADGKLLGPAPTTVDGSLTYVTPVPKAFSYRLQVTPIVSFPSMAWPSLRAEGPLTPGDYTRTLKVAGQSRSYLVHVPRNYQSKQATPVVLAFHGALMNAAMMIPFSGLNDKADTEGFIAVYPNGTGFWGLALTWNAGNCCGPASWNQADDVGFTRALLDDLAKMVHVDRRRVYATGMSNGGMMCYRLADALSDRIAAVAPVAGTMGTLTCHPKRPVSVMHFHGADDKILPFQGGMGAHTRTAIIFQSVENSIRAWVKADGCPDKPVVTKMPQKVDDGTSVERMTYGPGKAGSEVVLFRIEGGGHTWPGRDWGLDFLGKTTHNVVANDELWAFFQRHPMPVSAGQKRQLSTR